MRNPRRQQLLAFPFFFVLSTVLSFSLAFGQGQIKGIIKDRDNMAPLPFANVYLNLTSIGVATDVDGKFVLAACPVGTYELKVSFVGYEPETRKLLILDNETIELTITLKPQKNNLSEVEIKASRDKKWEKSFRRFEREFLGRTSNGRECQIVNPWVVNFEEPNGTWVMKATADQPVEVENLALGYRLFFFIKKFEIHSEKVILLGDIRFEAMKPTSNTQDQQWRDSRKDAYEGTERHLFNSMIHGSAEKAGFSLFAERSPNRPLIRSPYFYKELESTIVRYTVRIIPSHGKVTLFQIPIKGRMEVHYPNKGEAPFYRDINDQVAWIESNEETILCSESGIPQEPDKILLLGYLSRMRVGDMLPLDYQP